MNLPAYQEPTLRQRASRRLVDVLKSHGVHDSLLARKCAEAVMAEAGLEDGPGAYVRVALPEGDVVQVREVIRKLVDGGPGWSLMLVSPEDMAAADRAAAPEPVVAVIDGYQVHLALDDNGTVLATVPALPEVTTFGSDVREALERVKAAIGEALAARAAHG